MPRKWSTRRDPHRELVLHRTAQRGEDVEHVQAAINERGKTRGVGPIAVDGYMGPETLEAGLRVGYLLGALKSTVSKRCLTVGLQRIIVDPGSRTTMQKARARIRRREIVVDPVVKRVWHPDAIRIPHRDAGEFVSAGKKLVWHTTEGTGLPNYQGSAPHFTIDPRKGRLWQHMPINRAARTLKAGGPNFWGTIQVEVIAYARDSHGWPPAVYKELRELARWIEANGGVPRRSSVEFTDSRGVKRLGPDQFRAYAGHIGHQHAPAPNDHWDPGRLDIKRILE